MSDDRTPIHIDFFADVICPWCYVGWEAVKRAVEQRPHLAATLAWRTFALNPDSPKEGVDRQAYYAQRAAADPDRAKATREALIAAAEAAGAPMDLNAAAILPNTIDAHRVIHWAAGQGRAESMIDALFAAYFVRGENIGDARVLAALAGGVGLDGALIAELLASDADVETMLHFHMAAHRLGVSGVPVAIFQRKTMAMGAETPERYGKAIDAALAA
ncbi:MAG: disulfide bond formation protein DsbA [Alphaproteobacteria bacterium]|nr:disulfide bond formation protein DsbA [Alphaproteobacteria bacterium]